MKFGRAPTMHAIFILGCLFLFWSIKVLHQFGNRFGNSQTERRFKAVDRPGFIISLICFQAVDYRFVAFATHSHFCNNFWNITDADLVLVHDSKHAFVIGRRTKVTAVVAKFFVYFPSCIKRGMGRHPAFSKLVPVVIS